MSKVYDSFIAQKSDTVKWAATALEEALTVFADNRALLNDIAALPHFDTIFTGTYGIDVTKYTDRATISFRASDNEDDREMVGAFVRALTTLLGVQGRKQQTWDKKSLLVKWELQNLTINVTNYRPESCRLEITEEWVEDPEARVYEDNKVFVKKIRTELVCNDDAPETDEAPF